MRRLACLALLAACAARSPSARVPDLAATAPSDLATTDQATRAAPDLARAAGDGGGSCAVDGTATLVAFVDAVVVAMRAAGNAGSNALAVPATTDRDAFAARVLAILGGDESQACALPSSYRLVRLPGYRVIAEVDDTGQPKPSLMWGTYAAPLTRPSPSRRLAIEAPHPIFDANTEHQAADVFVQTGARWFLLAGSHRCADSTASGCSGTTTACGTSANYRISDAAHAVQLPFWAVHEQLSTADAQLAFLQLHGNAESCPAALVSDSSGTWSDSDFAGQFAAALIARSVAVGKCGNGYPTASCDLCGTDNVEARFTAGAADACTMMGASYGRFVHVEQQAGLRMMYQPLIDATAATFPVE